MPVTAEPKPVIGQDTSVENNLGLVHACAHRFKGRGIEYDDLFQAGCMGLVKASAAFDAGRGVMFSTYAVPVILGEIRRLFRDGGTVKVSRSLKELGLAAGRVRELLGSELGREATIAEVAGRMNRTPEEVAQALAATTPPLSLTGGEEDGSGQIDLPEESPEERLSDLLSLHQLLADLEERDRRLIFLRYYRGKTQTEVARQLGMTQVQVSRREKRLPSQGRKCSRHSAAAATSSRQGISISSFLRMGGSCLDVFSDCITARRGASSGKGENGMGVRLENDGGLTGHGA